MPGPFLGVLSCAKLQGQVEFEGYLKERFGHLILGFEESMEEVQCDCC